MQKGQIEKGLKDDSSLSKSTKARGNFCSKQKIHGGEKREKMLRNLIVSPSWWAFKKF